MGAWDGQTTVHRVQRKVPSDAHPCRVEWHKPPRSAPLDVLVIIAIRLYRDGIADVLSRAGFDASARAADLRGAMTLIGDRPPAVAVLDAADVEAREMVCTLRQRAPRMRIVALAIRGEPKDICSWAEAGIAGYVTIEDPLERLIEVVAAAARGEAYCSPRVSGALLQHVHLLAAGRSVAPALATLTSREREIAECLRDGLSNKEIAARLYIALPTVKNHVHRILGKLEVQHRHEAADALSPSLRSVDETFIWGLFDRAPLPQWSSGRVTLLGDACHPMLPFMAQGAAQALEDSATLTSCLTHDAARPIPESLRLYETARKPRATRVQSLSTANKTRFHLPDGSAQRERDEQMARGGTDFSIKAVHWIYAHDAGVVVPSTGGIGGVGS